MICEARQTLITTYTNQSCTFASVKTENLASKCVFKYPHMWIYKNKYAQM